MARTGMLLFVLAVLAAPMTMGCDFTKMAAGQTAHVFERAAPAFDAQSDYEFAGQAAAGSVMQLEGVLHVVPDNEILMLEASRGWTGYAFGYVEDEVELAELAGNMEEADRQRARARAMYLRARDLGRILLERREDGFEHAVAGGPDALRAFLAEEFDDEEDAPALFWTGYAWGSAINVSLDDPALIADVQLTRVLVERSVELDRDYHNAAGLTFLGYSSSIVNETFGGDPPRGRAYFEQALVATERKALLVQLNYARSYAVQVQDRALFEQLLNDVINAPDDVLPDARLPNAIAKRRAARYLRRVDDLFDPALREPTPDVADDADSRPRRSRRAARTRPT
jgi:hypothetical protein